MTTNSPNPNPSPKSDNSKQRLIAIAAVVIVALLAINAVLLFSYNKRGKANAQLTAQLDESDQLKAELEKQYYDALSELESMKGSNEELNALIEQQKEELTASKKRIDGLLVDSRNLAKARSEIGRLSAQVKQYVAEINQLREEVGMLAAENTNLTTQRDSLSTNLESERMMSAQLSSEKAMLVSEREQLSSTNEALSRKVNIASVVKVRDIEVDGQKTRKSGKAVTRRDADNVEQLQICFNTTANEIAEPGQEEFMVRVINPSGETMAIDNLGSGVFTSNATGEQVRYTLAKTINYDRKANNVCVMWAPGQTFQEGNYDIEIYNKGYLAGSTSMMLK